MVESIDLDPARYLSAPVVDARWRRTWYRTAIICRSPPTGRRPRPRSVARARGRPAASGTKRAWCGHSEARRAAGGPAARPSVGRRRAPARDPERAARDRSRSEGRCSALPTVFPEGLFTFPRCGSRSSGPESEQRTKQIAEPSVAKQLVSLVGDFIVVELNAAHEEYGRVLGITAAMKLAQRPPTSQSRSARSPKRSPRTRSSWSLPRRRT